MAYSYRKAGSSIFWDQNEIYMTVRSWDAKIFFVCMQASLSIFFTINQRSPSMRNIRTFIFRREGSTPLMIAFLSGLVALLVRDLLHWRINALTSFLPQLAQGRPAWVQEGHGNIQLPLVNRRPPDSWVHFPANLRPPLEQLWLHADFPEIGHKTASSIEGFERMATALLTLIPPSKVRTLPSILWWSERPPLKRLKPFRDRTRGPRTFLGTLLPYGTWKIKRALPGLGLLSSLTQDIFILAKSKTASKEKCGVNILPLP